MAPNVQYHYWPTTYNSNQQITAHKYLQITSKVRNIRQREKLLLPPLARNITAPRPQGHRRRRTWRLGLRARHQQLWQESPRGIGASSGQAAWVRCPQCHSCSIPRASGAFARAQAGLGGNPERVARQATRSQASERRWSEARMSALDFDFRETDAESPDPLTNFRGLEGRGWP